MKKEYTIAISITDKIDSDHLYSNGISQNIILLYELFELLGHKSILVPLSPRERKKIRLHNNKLFDIHTLDELKQADQKIHVFFEAGAVQNNDEKTLIKSLGARIVSIHYGNSLIMDMENILFKEDDKPGFQHLPDQIDYVLVAPQHAFGQSYLEVLYNVESDIAPFLWNPKFIDRKKFGIRDFREKPNIYTMEPNINIVKNSLIPMTIIEAFSRQYPDDFNQAFILNADEIKVKPYFLNNIVTNMHSLNASATKKKQQVFFSERCRFSDVFVHPDILLSHQWNNALNYLYLEALYKNIPLVHNSDFLSDVGYYYPDFDVRQGVDSLYSAITRHKTRLREEEKKNTAFLKQFSIHNKSVQNEYQRLLEKIV